MDRPAVRRAAITVIRSTGSGAAVALAEAGEAPRGRNDIARLVSLLAHRDDVLLIRLPQDGLDDGVDGWLADAVFAAGVDPASIWVDAGTRRDLLAAPRVVRAIAQRHLVACRVAHDDAFAARGSFGALGDLGVRLICLDDLDHHDVPDGLADAIRLRALCRRAHINGMAVLMRSADPVDVEAIRGLGVDLAQDHRRAA